MSLKIPTYIASDGFQVRASELKEIYLRRLSNGHAFKDFFRFPRFVLPHQPKCARSWYKLQGTYLLTDA